MATATRSPFATVNPYTGEVVREFELISDEQLEGVIGTSSIAYQSWSRRPVAERAAVVGRAAELLRERSEEVARTITLEMGKLIRHSRAELDLGVRILEYYAESGPELLAEEPLEIEGGSAVVVNEPLGPLLAIEPWNFPVYQVVRMAAPNLVLGNTILLKHASITPLSGIAMEQLFTDAGAPPGVYTNLLIDIPQVRRIDPGEPARTGSVADGQRPCRI